MRVSVALVKLSQSFGKTLPTQGVNVRVSFASHSELYPFVAPNTLQVNSVVSIPLDFNSIERLHEQFIAVVSCFVQAPQTGGPQQVVDRITRLSFLAAFKSIACGGAHISVK